MDPQGGRKHKPSPALQPDPAVTQDRISAAYALSRHQQVWQDARDEWHWRQQASAQLVRRGQLDEAARTDRLRPWLAIACLCDVDLPELTDIIARHRTLRLDEPAQGSTRAQAILLAADEICAERAWRAELARAFEVAAKAHADSPTDANERHVRRLARMTGALCVPLPPIPFPEIDLEPEQEAA